MELEKLVETLKTCRTELKKMGMYGGFLCDRDNTLSIQMDYKNLPKGEAFYQKHSDEYIMKVVQFGEVKFFGLLTRKEFEEDMWGTKNEKTA